MATGPRYHVPFRRRREGKTNYRKRLGLLRSGKTRAVVRKSGSGISVQMVDYYPEGDRIVAQASYNDLRKLGWTYSLKDTSASYLTGLIAGRRAMSADVQEAVLDMGITVPTKGNRLFAVLKGMLDAGMSIPHGEHMFPNEGRIKGAIKKDKKFDDAFETMKAKILEM
ncbi:MAG: 50S ribosomal protein L18 [Thermoplasmatota archaeon]